MLHESPFLFFIASSVQARYIANDLQLDPALVVRLAYGGRVYHDNETLESQPYWDFANNFILTALVFQ
jgi:hypothetical protein